MTELVVITAVSSVLGTLTFGYFVWLGLGLRKALKMTEDNLDRILSLRSRVDEDFAKAWNRFEIETENFYKRIHEVDDRMNRRDDCIVEAQRTDVNTMLDEIDKVRKDVDRRFDRVYSKLYTEFPQLKEVEQQINS